MINLDYIAAKYAPMLLEVPQNERDKSETHLNQGLGVLAEQGPFALLLWAKARDKSLHRKVCEKLPLAMEEIDLPALNGAELLEYFRENICQNFVNLTVTRQLFDRILTYARFYAKGQ